MIRFKTSNNLDYCYLDVIPQNLKGNNIQTEGTMLFSSVLLLKFDQAEINISLAT